jgi:hypothetical protein
MRFPSAANPSVASVAEEDCVAEADCLAEAGDAADGAWPSALALSPTARICSPIWARIWARIKEPAPISNRVKTANPAIAGKRRNVLDAAKIIASIRAYWPHGGEPKPHALQASLPVPSPLLPLSADAKERQNVLSFAALAACPGHGCPRHRFAVVGKRQAEARRYVTAKRAVTAAPPPPVFA